MRRILLLLVTLLAPAVLADQGAPELTAGARVRFWESGLHGPGRVAVVSAVSGDTLSLQLEHVSYRLRMSALDRLEISAGRTRSRRNGALLGFGIGVLVGGILGYTTGRGTAPLCDLQCNTRPLDSALGSLAGGLLGAGVGAIVGSPAERWVQVPLPPR